MVGVAGGKTTRHAFEFCHFSQVVHRKIAVENYRNGFGLFLAGRFFALLSVDCLEHFGHQFHPAEAGEIPFNVRFFDAALSFQNGLSHPYSNTGCKRYLF
jgi:hypothetical protein